MADGPCTRLQSRLSVFLETTSGAVDEFQTFVLAFLRPRCKRRWHTAAPYHIRISLTRCQLMI